MQVNQSDRDAAEQWRWSLFDKEDFDPMKQVELDLLELAEAFAAHREAERARVVALVKRLLSTPDTNVDRALDELICCNGHMCGCRGSSVREYLIYQFTSAIERGELLENGDG